MLATPAFGVIFAPFSFGFTGLTIRRHRFTHARSHLHHTPQRNKSPVRSFATGRYVRGHVANVISFLAHLSGSANVVTGFEFPRAEKLPANARSLTARKLRWSR